MTSARMLFLFLHTAVATVRGSDDFAQRRVLPSAETVNIRIGRPATLSYEPLDPLTRRVDLNYYVKSQGSLWYEWTAPRDGFFKVAATATDGAALQTFVYEGDSLARLLRVQNGNWEGVSLDSSTVFSAVRGRAYQIGVSARVVTDVRGDGTDTDAGGMGTLSLTPAHGPPANDSLAKRSVLDGPVPITASGSNLAPHSPTAHSRLHRMTQLDFVDNWQLWGPVLWWEWTCPKSGVYDLRSDSFPRQYHQGAQIFIARRRALPGGGVSAPGDWNTDGVPATRRSFQAAAGEVFDIALTSRRPNWPGNVFGEFSFTLDELPAAVPSNLTPETALQLPSTLPLDYSFQWRGQSLVTDDGPPVSLFFRFTAPADGYYLFDWDHFFGWVWGAGDVLLNYSRERLHLMRAGEHVMVRFENLYPEEELTFRIRARLIPIQPVADSMHAPVELGPAADFMLIGNSREATLEQGEPAFPPPSQWDPPVTGSLWWRWTAPSTGWLYNAWDWDIGGDAGEMECFTETMSPVPPLEFRVWAVEAGRTYLFRAGLTQRSTLKIFVANLRMTPAVTNQAWQTAVDLGGATFPQWRPASPVMLDLPSQQWFRWTPLVTVRGDVETGLNGGLPVIYTDPATGRELARDPASNTWEFSAGQTYWLRHPSQWTLAWFQMIDSPLTAHGDIATAQDLGEDLPAGGTISTCGDTNSPAELSLLARVVPPGQLTPQTPAVWWKWRSSRDQFIRFARDSSGILGDPSRLFVFSGPDLATSAVVENPFVSPYDFSGEYLRVRQGETYWFAGVGQMDVSQTREFTRLDLRQVFEIPPPNDNLAAASPISSDALEQGQYYYGTHQGAGWQHPLRYEWAVATLEDGEPAVSAEQTASTWWEWIAPAPGVYRLDVLPAAAPGELDDSSRLPREAGGPVASYHLTVNVFSGDSLAALQPVPLTELTEGQHLFQAAGGTRYSIRVASGSELTFYSLRLVAPAPSAIFDFWAVENHRPEDAGYAWVSSAEDGMLNFHKLIFGFDYRLPVEDPDNAAARARLPRPIPSGDALEMRCFPDPSLAPGGSYGYLSLYGAALYGRSSADLRTWADVAPVALPGGELSLRVPFGSASRSFLKWEMPGPPDAD
jgi:hypothetical protein